MKNKNKIILGLLAIIASIIVLFAICSTNLGDELTACVFNIGIAFSAGIMTTVSMIIGVYVLLVIWVDNLDTEDFDNDDINDAVDEELYDERNEQHE